MSENKSLTVKEELKNDFIEVFGQKEYPIAISEGINNIMEIVNSNKSISDLYPRELQEIPVSTSMFQDSCVQMEQHYTSQRKLRQSLMELDGKLNALDSAKNGHKKAIVKLAQLEDEINELQEIYEKLERDDAIIDFELGILMSAFTYTTSKGESTYSNTIIPETLINVLSTGKEIEDKKVIKVIRNKVKVALGNKIVDFEEAERGLKSAQHMVKDAAVKSHQLQTQVDKYKQEVAESPYSYEEAEVVYYVMYFTADAEKQLRTGDHQIDRGTYGAISQLPGKIRRKVQENIHFIKNKLRNEDYPEDGDYIFKVFEEVMLPKKTGDGEIEGMSVQDYLGVETIKLLSQTTE